MTVPGVYSPSQGQQEAWEQSQGLANRLMGSGKPDPERPYDATIRAAAESDGVDDSRAVEVMARAIAKVDHNGRVAEEGYWSNRDTGCDHYRRSARAALGALRALEGK